MTSALTNRLNREINSDDIVMEIIGQMAKSWRQLSSTDTKGNSTRLLLLLLKHVWTAVTNRLLELQLVFSFFHIYFFLADALDTFR